MKSACRSRQPHVPAERQAACHWQWPRSSCPPWPPRTRHCTPKCSAGEEGGERVGQGGGGRVSPQPEEGQGGDTIGDTRPPGRDGRARGGGRQRHGPPARDPQHPQRSRARQSGARVEGSRRGKEGAGSSTDSHGRGTPDQRIPGGGGGAGDSARQLQGQRGRAAGQPPAVSSRGAAAGALCPARPQSTARGTSHPPGEGASAVTGAEAPTRRGRSHIMAAGPRGPWGGSAADAPW